jgi:prepilin-type N-terminal cleavage/methylation domain-containing protein
MNARRTIRGTSLIEVMVAVALLAIVMLAVASSQLAMARAQRTTIWRERALWLADARIERMRVAPDAHAGLSALASASLPDGTLTVDGGQGGVRLAIVGWRDSDTVAPARCDAAGASVRARSCVRMPFAQGHVDER